MFKQAIQASLLQVASQPVTAEAALDTGDVILIILGEDGRTEPTRKTTVMILEVKL